jgi:hypothetical protein
MHIINNPFYVVFLLLPPILRLYEKKGLNYSPVIPFYFFFFVGWLCFLLGYEYHSDRLGEYIFSMPDPPEEMVEDYTEDASRITVYLFGWMPTVIYFFIWRIFI